MFGTVKKAVRKLLAFTMKGKLLAFLVGYAVFWDVCSEVREESSVARMIRREIPWNHIKLDLF